MKSLTTLSAPLLSLLILVLTQTAWGAPGLLDQAVALEKKGKLADAIRIHEKIALKFPKLKVPSYVTIGGLYGKMGKFDREIEWCQKAVAIDPGFANAYLNLGAAYIAKQNSTGAEAAFLKARELDPRSPIATYSLGLIAEAKDDLKQAEALYRKAVELDPAFTDAWVNLGVTLARQTRLKEAEEALKKAETLDPTAQDIRNLLKKVRADLAK